MKVQFSSACVTSNNRFQVKPKQINFGLLNCKLTDDAYLKFYNQGVNVAKSKKEWKIFDSILKSLEELAEIPDAIIKKSKKKKNK